MTTGTLPTCCAWCSATISGTPAEGQPVSHGICPECFDGLMGGLEEGMPFKITNYGDVSMAHSNGVHVPDVQPADGPPVVKTLGDQLREDQAASPYDPAWSERFVPTPQPDPVLAALVAKLESATGLTGSQVGWQGDAQVDSLSLAIIARSLATLAGWRAARV